MRKKQVWRIKEKPSRSTFLELNDVDRLVLLELSYEEINKLIINKKIQTILDDNEFWCLWLRKNKNISATEECKSIAKHLQISIEDDYLTALQEGNLKVIKALYNTGLYDVNSMVCIGFKDEDDDEGDDCLYEFPLIIAVEHEQLAMIEFLLSFDIEQYILDNALIRAIYQNVNYRIIQALVNKFNHVNAAY